MAQNIGMIGCGLMGHGIAKNLLDAGHALTILDHPGNQPSDDLSTLGATFSADLGEVASAKDAVILVLPGSPEVEAVVLGKDGLLEKLTTGTLVIDATSAEPDRTLQIAAAIQGRKCGFVDAPMTRTPKEAEEGRLNVLMGGSDDDVARAKSIIQAYAENISHGGPVSAGHRLKLLHNFVSLGQAVIIAEALATAMRGGVDAAVLVDVLATGGAGGVALERLRPYVERGSVESFKFAIKNAAKDLGYYATMAETLGAAHKTADAVRTVLADAAERHGAAAMPELISILSDE